MSQSITLTKGTAVNLLKDCGVEQLKVVEIGLGWEAAQQGSQIDLDASIVALDSSGEGAKGEAFCFFGQKSVLGNCIRLSGDDLTGADDGEGAHAPDEVITVKLTDLPQNINRLLVIINSYTGQDFDKIANAFVTVYDSASGSRLVEYDLDEQFKGLRTLIVAIIDRQPDASWVFKAAGIQAPGLKELLASYGMNV